MYDVYPSNIKPVFVITKWFDILVGGFFGTWTVYVTYNLLLLFLRKEEVNQDIEIIFAPVKVFLCVKLISFLSFYFFNLKSQQ